MSTDEPTLERDPEWERVLERVRLEELRDQRRALALNNSHGLPMIAIEYALRLFFRSAFFAVVLVGTGWGLWVADGHWIPFDSASWKAAMKNPNGITERRLWNRFETQYQPIGMSRKKLTQLLSKPSTPSTVFSRDAYAAYFFGNLLLPGNAGVNFKFKNDIVTSYQMIPATLS